MLNLILKDILIQKKYFYFVLGYIAISLVTMSDSSALYYLVSVTIAFLFSISSFAYEEKNKCDMVINSLPVTRREVILSKYISIILFSLISVAIMSILGIIVNAFHISYIKLGSITLSEIKSIIFTCVILSSVMFPIYFKFGYTKGRLVTFIIYFIFFGLASTITSSMDEEPIKSIVSAVTGANRGTYQILGFIVLIGIYAVSLILSMGLYEKKDL